MIPLLNKIQLNKEVKITEKDFTLETLFNIDMPILLYTEN